MEGTYTVEIDGAQAATVTVRRQGLYLDVVCRCSRGGRLELIAQTERGRENLGLLVPMHGGVGLHTRVAAKKLEGEHLRFFLRARAETVAVDAQKPFGFLQRLDRAYLVRDGEQVRIGFFENPPEKGGNGS